MSNQKPFYPMVFQDQGYVQPDQQYQPQQLAMQTVATPTYNQTPIFGPDYLWCQTCKSPLAPGEHCIDLLYGMVGRGSKSGQAMVVPDPKLEEKFPGTNNPVLCVPCAIVWLDMEFFGGEYFNEFWMESEQLYRVLDEDEEG